LVVQGEDESTSKEAKAFFLFVSSGWGCDAALYFWSWFTSPGLVFKGMGASFKKDEKVDQGGYVSVSWARLGFWSLEQKKEKERRESSRGGVWVEQERWRPSRTGLLVQFRFLASGDAYVLPSETVKRYRVR
jgi:hypothetical protein